MSELWSSQQHEWLTALGHTVYVPGSAEAPAVAARPAPVEATRPPPRTQAAPPPTAPRKLAPQAEASAPAPATPAPRRAASPLADKLHFALIRASGCDPNTPEAAAAIAQWPASSELRGNPVAKRALWPQLRALRRRQPE
ncbi:MAG: alanine acetyltransferase [Pseudoxanthomonas sp.]